MVASAADLVSQPAAVLDRARWVKVLRVICRIILIVTGNGNNAAFRGWYGWRIVDLNGAAIAAPLDVRLTAAVDKREDWLYRKDFGFNVAAADAAKVLFSGDGGESFVMFDFKPNRRLQYGQALVLSYGVTLLGGAFGAGMTIDASAAPEVLLTGV